MTVLGWSFVCNHITLCCCHRPCVDRMYDNFGSICQISLRPCVDRMYDNFGSICQISRRPCVDRMYDNFGSICQISCYVLIHQLKRT